MQSMTGFGSCEGSSFKITIRSLNHRFCEVTVKMPASMLAIEDDIKKLVKKHLKRGRIEVSITKVERDVSHQDQFIVNMTLARSYLNSLKKMSSDLGIAFDAGIDSIAKVPGVVSQKETSVELKQIVPVLNKLMLKAIDNVNYIRDREAKEIKKDFSSRIKILERIVRDIGRRAPGVVSEYASRLKKRVSRLSKNLVNFDSKQLLAEVTVFAERSDITEELVRLNSHVKQFRGTMAQKTPTGRTLDFILQEMHREVNTIGSKANDFNISQHVVVLKAELEKLREQVQNVL
ncbi:MAG: YicC/YloC family endoribonuclease [bacterium]